MGKDKFDFYYVISLVGQIGYTVALPLIVFILLGVFLDKKLGIKPILTLTGLVIGMLASFYALYQLIKPFLSNKKGTLIS